VESLDYHAECVTYYDFEQWLIASMLSRNSTETMGSLDNSEDMKKKFIIFDEEAPEGETQKKLDSQKGQIENKHHFQHLSSY
jgi:hypothetical protein